MTSDTNLIYIMGRGHSGSTVLDGMIGNGKDIESVGELIAGIGCPERLCGCGSELQNCEFWKQVRAEFEYRSKSKWGESVALIVNQAHIFRFFKTLISSKKSAFTRKLVEINNILVQAILHASQKQCVLDSSKEYTRGLFFIRFFPSAKIVHLIRNPENILASDFHRINNGTGFKFLRHTYYGKNWAPVFLMQSSINWVAGNFLAGIIKLIDPSRILLVRYEDMCTNPGIELSRIASFTGYDLKNLIDKVEKGETLELGHNIGGNQMRMKKNFIFDPTVGTKRTLPKFYKVITRFITWPFLLLYGYPLLK